MGNETLFADDTLIAKISGMILHMLVQLNGCGECAFAMLATIWFFFVMDKFYMSFQLECLGKCLIAEHANVRPNFCMHSCIMLLEMRLPYIGSATFLHINEEIIKNWKTKLQRQTYVTLERSVLICMFGDMLFQ